MITPRGSVVRQVTICRFGLARSSIGTGDATVANALASKNVLELHFPADICHNIAVYVVDCGAKDAHSAKIG